MNKKMLFLSICITFVLSAFSGSNVESQLSYSKNETLSSNIQIIVDGNCDEWPVEFQYEIRVVGIGHGVDVENKSAFALANNDSLYVCVIGLEGLEEFSITLSTGDNSQVVLEWSLQTGLFTDAGRQYSQSKLRYSNGSMEFRIDLSEINPESDKISSIIIDQLFIKLKSLNDGSFQKAILGSDEEVAFVDENDPDDLATAIPRTSIDYLFGVPVEYHVNSLIAPPIGDLFTVAASETGYIYAQSFSPDRHGVYVYDPNTRVVTKIRDNAGGMDITEGPGDAIFIMDEPGRKILLLYPDGSTTEWALIAGGKRNVIPHTYTSNGQMFGSINRTSVVEIFPDGTYNTIAEGFQTIMYIGQMPDGALIVTEFLTENGRVTRIEPDGTKTTIFRGMGDSANYLKVSSTGKLYLNGDKTGLIEMDPNTGQILKRYGLLYRGGECKSGFGFSFLDESHIAFANNRLGSISVANLEDESVQYLAGGFPVNIPLGVGPDGTLYAATSACEESGQNIPRIIAISPEGEVTNIFDLPASNRNFYFHDLVVDQYGVIYFTIGGGVTSSPLNYVSPGEEEAQQINISNLNNQRGPSSLSINPITGNVFIAPVSGTPIFEITPDRQVISHAIEYPEKLVKVKIAFASDGTLFATGADEFGEKSGPTTKVYVLLVDLIEGNTEEIYTWDHEGTTGGSTAIAIDEDGNIWLHTNGDIEGYAVIRVSKEGQVEPMISMDGTGIDANGLAISKNGDIFVAGPNGIFRVYDEK